MNYDKNNNIAFDDGYKTTYSDDSKTSKIILWTMKYTGGFVKNEKQANYILLGFVVFVGIVLSFLFLGGNQSNENLQPSDLMRDSFPPSE